MLKNVSLGGAFIETGSTQLPLDAPVVLTFHARHMGEWLNGRDLHAMVIRVTAEGAGIMFIDPDLETVRALRDFVYSAPTSSSLALQVAKIGVSGPSIGKQRREHWPR
jgi:hypothetical protein